MPNLRILLSECHDPYFNLAVEDAIFQNMEVDRKILYLWRNADTVVIGKGQNPWKECNTEKMESDDIKLVRRKSGGGAVFHDLGNTNFTFMGAKPEYDKTVSTQIVLKALANIGVSSAKATGRNDLVVEREGVERKFSGPAYRWLQDRGFHHGTQLLSADLSRLANYLNPDPKKLQGKSVASVRARVMNLCEVVPDISHRTVCDAIAQEFMQHYGEHVDSEVISIDGPPGLPGFETIYQDQQDWNWNFGRALAFSHTIEERFPWGGVELHLDVHQGVINDAKVFTDSLYPDILAHVVDHLVGHRYDALVVFGIIKQAAFANPTHERELLEMGAWLQNALR